MSRSRWILVALLLIILLATGLRAYRLDAQSLWYDEGSSLVNAQRTPAQIWRASAADIHPPGYYLALAGWTRLSGQSEIALRAMSLLFGVLLIPVTYALGRRLFNPTVGLLSALLLSINPFQIYYSQETRMYALLALLSGLSLWLFLHWLDAVSSQSKTWPSLLALVLVNALGLYTHYFFPFFLIIQSLAFLTWWLWESGQQRRLRLIANWAGANIASILIYLPWLPTAFAQLSGYPREPLLVAVSDGLLTIASLLVYGRTLPVSDALPALIALGLLAMVGLFPPFDADDHTRPSHNWRSALVLLWLLLPTASMFVFKLYRPQLLKFMLPVTIAPALLLGRGLWMSFRLAQPGAPGAARRGGLLIIVVALAAFGLAPTLISLNNLYFDPAYARDDYRALATHLRSVAGPEDAIILNGPAQQDVFGYYYPSTANLHLLPDDDTLTEIDSILSTSTRVYVIFYGEKQRDPQNLIEGTLDTRAFEAASNWYGDVRLVTYGVSPNLTNRPAVTLDARFGPNVRLLGYTLDTGQLQPAGLLNLTLFWQTDAPLAQSYKVFVHLSSPDGGVPLAQHDGAPGGGLQLTNAWQTGQTVRDNHGLLIPANMPPGEYDLLVGIYLPGGERLPITLDGTAVSDSLLLTTLSVK